NRLAQNGFAVQFLRYEPDAATLHARLCQLGGGEGLRAVCIIGACDAAVIKKCFAVPVVLCGACIPAEFPSVVWDLQAAARESVAYLIDLGHRNIAMLCGPGTTQNEFALLAEGYESAHQMADV